MKVLELFAGSCSIGKAAEKLGCEVFSSDIRDFDRLRLTKDEANIHYKVDIREFDITKLPFKPDIIWASPPCTAFSVASCWLHWKGPKDNRVPATDKALLGIELVKKTMSLIEELEPTYWFIENPRGMLRTRAFISDWVKEHGGVRNTVTYCQYGDTRMKPTDIWTNLKSWKPRDMCKKGMPCHEASPRGTYGGVSGQKSSYERSRIPQELCTDIIQACKDDAESKDNPQSFRMAA